MLLFSPLLLFAANILILCDSWPSLQHLVTNILYPPSFPAQGASFFQTDFSISICLTFILVLSFLKPHSAAESRIEVAHLLSILDLRDEKDRTYRLSCSSRSGERNELHVETAKEDHQRRLYPE